MSCVMGKPILAYAKTRFISAFVFATWMVHFLFYLYPNLSSVTALTGLCQIWSETLKIGFLASQLISKTAASMETVLTLFFVPNVYLGIQFRIMQESI